MKVDITVIKEPVTVEFECPHCKEDISRSFNDFEAEIGEVCNWQYSQFECPECDGVIEIDDIDWD